MMSKAVKAKARKARDKMKQASAKIDAGFAALPIDAPVNSRPGVTAPPSLLDTVIELRPYTRREQLVRLLCPKYNVTPRTVDRAIAAARDLAVERFKDKDKVLTDGLDFLQRISAAAYKDKEYSAARGATMDQQKLIGNTRPDVVIIGSMDAPADDQIKLADELKKKIDAAKHRRS